MAHVNFFFVYSHFELPFNFQTCPSRLLFPFCQRLRESSRSLVLNKLVNTPLFNSVLIPVAIPMTMLPADIVMVKMPKYKSFRGSQWELLG